MNKAFTNTAKCMVLAISCQMLFACKTIDMMTKKSDVVTSESQAANPEQAVERQQMKVHDEHFIPKQQYDAQGQKIPYVAEPNPYTTNQKPVKKETRVAFQSAVRNLKAGKIDQARSKFQALADQNSELSGVWVHLARISEQQSDLEGAESALKKAIEANDDNVAAYNALALVLRKQGKFDGAQDAYLAALEQWPDFAEAHYNLGVLYDLYYNNPLAAQKHFEAYDFLTASANKKVAKWLVELKRRSGVKKSFIYEPPVLVASKAVSEESAKHSKAL